MLHLTLPANLLRMRWLKTFALFCGSMAVIANINFVALLDLVPKANQDAPRREATSVGNTDESDNTGLCLKHPAITISLSDMGSLSLDNSIGQAGQLVLQQPTGVCGKLRRRVLWEDRSSTGLELSPLAREIEKHQTNCALPIGIFKVDNRHGLGSHMHQWSQLLCNGRVSGHRIRTYNPEWLWQDQTYCPLQTTAMENSTSVFDCYFPAAEPACLVDTTPKAVVTVVPGTFDKNFTWCDRVKNDKTFRAEWRAASMEYMFRRVSPLVLKEAERQVGLMFPGAIVPEDLVVVHIRWGDKYREMKLADVTEYINAVKTLLNDRSNSSNANIFLATEDPAAIDQFKKGAPSKWKIYVDRTITELNVFRPCAGNNAVSGTLNTKGRGGLVALGSLLVALEANKFVLTTGSNWSRLINELRKNVLDRACGFCTSMVDLRSGEY